ncbi:MAG TPA: cytochrome c [Gemmatimonadaceae bacterium]|jgi:mono/diheme cytochrome c family protein|nr:cytochrome c [Gemmatimonadaceae bacterium]
MSAELRTTLRRAALALVAMGSLSACSWFTDMKQQPKWDPWESASDTIPFRANPQNSVSVYGTAAPGYEYGRTALPGTIDSMAAIPNPVPADARSLANGRKYFQINCAVCHGVAGAGDGIATKYGMVPMPLTSDHAKGLTDGYIFGMIRNGRGLMPTYNRIEEPDRWDVVNYVRALQGKLPGVTVPTGPLGIPGETGDKVPGATQMGPNRPAPYYHHIGSQAGVALDANQHAMGSSEPAAAPADTSKKGGQQ